MKCTMENLLTSERSEFFSANWDKVVHEGLQREISRFSTIFDNACTTGNTSLGDFSKVYFGHLT